MDNPTNVPANSGGALAWKDKLVEYVISHAGALVSALVVVGDRIHLLSPRPHTGRLLGVSVHRVLSLRLGVLSVPA